MQEHQRLLALCLGITLASLEVGCSSSGAASNPPFVEPVVASTFTSGITAGAGLYNAVDGPDGRIWFTEFEGDNLAAVTTSGTVTEYPMGVSSQPCGITVGPDSNIWTAGYGSTIEKVSTSGTVLNTYTVSGAHICAIISGPGGLLWFADYGNDKVGTISTSGTVIEYTLSGTPEPVGIAVGDDGNLWVTDLGNAAIDKISPAGSELATYSSGISASEDPNYIIAAPDGKLYFTEDASNSTISDKIGRITTGGTITEIGTLPPQTYPNSLAIGKDHNVYFTEYYGTDIGKITTASGSVMQFAPGIGMEGGAIVNGPDNRLWVGTEQTIYVLTY